MTIVVLPSSVSPLVCIHCKLILQYSFVYDKRTFLIYFVLLMQQPIKVLCNLKTFAKLSKLSTIGDIKFDISLKI